MLRELVSQSLDSTILRQQTINQIHRAATPTASHCPENRIE